MAMKPSTSLKVQITRLEMTAPPKTSLNIPVNIQAAIMRAPKIPLPFYRYLYRQVGARWQWVDRLRMSDEKLAAIVHDDRTDISVLHVNGAPAGFFEYFREDDETIELTHFGLIEHALGLGIGKWFLLQALYALWVLNLCVMGAQPDACRDDHQHPRPSTRPTALPDVRIFPRLDRPWHRAALERQGIAGDGEARLI
jgi:hypothetical protein